MMEDGTILLGVLIDFEIITVLAIDGSNTSVWQQFDQTDYVINLQCTIAKVDEMKLIK